MIKNLSKFIRKNIYLVKTLMKRKKKFQLTKGKIKIIGTGLLLCHLINIYKKTDIEFIHKKNEQNIKILNSIKSLKQAYLQSPFFLSTCLEIFYGNIDKRETVKYKRKIIYTKEGEQIALDFCESDSKKEKIKTKKKKNSKKPPIVLLIPGLCGHSNSPYIK